MLLRRNKTKSRIQAAEKALRKGDLPTAIAAFEETVRRNPEDVKSRRQLADVYCKAGRFGDAVHELQALAGSYAANGLLLKAISACKAILDIDPDHTETQATLARLFAKKRGGGLGGHKTTLPSAMSRGVSQPHEGVDDADIVEADDVAVVDDDVVEVDDLDVEIEEAGEVPVAAPPPTPPDDAPDGEDEEPISLDDVDLDEQPEEEVVLAGGEDEEESISLDDVDLDEEPAAKAAATKTAAGGEISLEGDALEEVLAADEQVEEIAHQLAEAEDEDLDARELDSALDALGGDEDEIDLDGVEADDLVVGEADHEVEVDSDELPEFPLFSELPLHAFQELVSRLQLWQVPPDAVVVSQGEMGQSFFVIVSGRARVERDGEVLATLGPGEFFGEMALLSKNPRTASVIADEDAELFEIKKDLLDEITERYKSVERVLMKFCRERLLQDVIRSSLFRGLEEEHVRAMVDSFKTKRVDMGQQILKQGNKGRGLFVILAGEVDVSREADGERRTLSVLSEGDVFGEGSLLKDQPATATVTTLKNATLLMLSKQGFKSFCAKHPVVLQRLEELHKHREAENEAASGRADSRMV